MSILTITIGGVYVRWGIIDDDLKIIDSGKYKTNVFDSKPLVVLKNIATKMNEVVIDNEDIEGVCVAFHGVISKDGIIIDPPKTLANYKGINLAAEFRKIINLKIIAVSISTAISKCEIERGKLRDVELGMLINISSSIEGGIVSNGKLIGRECGSTGQFGKQLIDGQPWELTSSSWMLLNHLILMTGDKNIISSDIARIINENDSFFSQFDKWSYDFAIGLHNLIVTINPKVIVISGGITNNEHFTLKHIIRHLYKFVKDETLDKTIIKISDHNENGSLIGAAIHFKNQ